MMMTEDELFEYIKQHQEPNDDYSFIYLWIHPILELNYLGSSSKHPDFYIGSGVDFKEQLKKNPIEEWTRIILAYVPKDQQYDIEDLFLKFYNVANNPKFLNRTNVAEGFGIGEDNCNYTHGLYVGCPKDDAQARKIWFESLTPEHQEAIRTYELEKSKIWKQENLELYRSIQKKYYQKNKEDLLSYYKEYYEKNKEEKLYQAQEYYQKLTPEQKQRKIDNKRIRRHTIKRIIQMDNTYTKEYFKGMKLEEVQKIEENIKKNIENNSNSLERFF